MRKGVGTRVEAPAPRFRDLSKREAEGLLTRNQVGRIGFSFHDAVDIRPIHYVFDDGWIFGRTSESDKLTTLRHNQWVAFEVDEVAGPFDWKSVIAHGTFYRLEAEGSEYDLKLYDRALETLRRLMPTALTEADPVPFRTELFGIAIDSISGRSCSSRSKNRVGLQ